MLIADYSKTKKGEQGITGLISPKSQTQNQNSLTQSNFSQVRTNTSFSVKSPKKKDENFLNDSILNGGYDNFSSYSVFNKGLGARAVSSQDTKSPILRGGYSTFNERKEEKQVEKLENSTLSYGLGILGISNKINKINKRGNSLDTKINLEKASASSNFNTSFSSFNYNPTTTTVNSKFFDNLIRENSLIKQNTEYDNQFNSLTSSQVRQKKEILDNKSNEKNDHRMTSPKYKQDNGTFEGVSIVINNF